jgi:hypothetical protein
MSNSIGTGFSPSATGRSGWSTGGLSLSAKFIPGLGFNIVNCSGTPFLGGGFRGIMPQPLILHDNSSEFSKTRFFLKDAWNTSCESGSSFPCRIIGPFRAVNNAGDLLNRINYSCGGTCQSFQSRPNLKGLRGRFGSISNACTSSVTYSSVQNNNAVPASACNGKYVYDGSDYIDFKKKQAINRNYNDRSFGGNESNASQSNIRAIRRY